eukprot:gene10845-7511_t
MAGTTGVGGFEKVYELNLCLIVMNCCSYNAIIMAAPIPLPCTVGEYVLIRRLAGSENHNTYLGVLEKNRNTSENRHLFLIRAYPLSLIRINPALRHKLERRALVSRILDTHILEAPDLSTNSSENESFQSFLSDVFISFVSSTELWTVERYFSGGSLLAALRSFRDQKEMSDVHSSFLPLPRVRIWMHQIVVAVKYLHEKLLLAHRSLSLDTIFIDSPDRLCIGGFDQCAPIGRSVASGMQNTLLFRCNCAFIHYASPEMIRSEAYNGEDVDVWAMGVIFYALLFHSFPFDGFQDDGSLVHAILAGEWKKNASTRKHFEDPLAEDLLSGMLEVNPSLRLTLKEIESHPFFTFYSQYNIVTIFAVIRCDEIFLSMITKQGARKQSRFLLRTNSLELLGLNVRCRYCFTSSFRFTRWALFSTYRFHGSTSNRHAFCRVVDQTPSTTTVQDLWIEWECLTSAEERARVGNFLHFLKQNGVERLSPSMDFHLTSRAAYHSVIRFFIAAATPQFSGQLCQLGRNENGETILIFRLFQSLKAVMETSDFFSRVTSLEILELNNKMHGNLVERSSCIWSTEGCVALSSVIRCCPCLESLTMRDLSWSDLSLKHSLSDPSNGIQTVMEAIKFRGREQILERCGSTLVPLKELHLFSMSALLNSAHFLNDVLPTLHSLVSFSISQSSMLLDASGPWKCETINLSNVRVTYWSLLLDALQIAIGGWHQLRSWCIADCGLNGKDAVEPLIGQLRSVRNMPPWTSVAPTNEDTLAVQPMVSNLRCWNISNNPWITNLRSDEADQTVFLLSSCLCQCNTLGCFEARHCYIQETHHLQWLGEGLGASFGSLRVLPGNKRQISTKLEELNFSRCGLTSRFLLYLSSLLWRSPRTQSIELSKESRRSIAFIPNLKRLDLGMNGFLPLSCQQLESFVDEQFSGNEMFVEGKKGRNDAQHRPLHLFDFNANQFAGDSLFRNRGDGKVLTSYELDRKDAQERRLRFKGLNVGQSGNSGVVGSSNNDMLCYSEYLKGIIPMMWLYLGKALTNGSSHLQLLDMSDTGLTDGSITELLSAPLVLPELQHLLLANNNIFSSPSSSDALCRCIEHCATKLVTLDLSCTEFDDLALSTLCDGMISETDRCDAGVLCSSKMKQLQQLCLSHTRLTDEGIDSLIDGLSQEECLQNLRCFLCVGNCLSESKKSRSAVNIIDFHDFYIVAIAEHFKMIS